MLAIAELIVTFQRNLNIAHPVHAGKSKVQSMRSQRVARYLL